ncbi:hypothetical protein Tco_0555114 [Tanacetum coccineum]
MECQVESLMRSEVLLDYKVGFTFPERPYQDECKGRILNVMDHQEDQIRQLEDVGNFELLLPVLLYYDWFKIDTAAND